MQTARRSPLLPAAGAMAFLLASASCQPPPGRGPVPQPAPPGPSLEVPLSANPPAHGFDTEGSDPRAVEIADRVMARLGGWAAWDQTRYLTWRFFGKRRHVWDKWTGDLRFEDGDLTVLTNLHTRLGSAWRGGAPVSDPASLTAILDQAHRAWINDSYWLVMPYKLKDTGVTLKYGGEGMTEEGVPAHVLELTFNGVGVTPQNRYRVWVDVHDSLVRQWAFFAEASDAEPRFVLPWSHWQPHGRIWLANDFGRSRHTEVAAYDDLPAEVFTRPDPVTLPPGE